MAVTFLLAELFKKSTRGGGGRANFPSAKIGLGVDNDMTRKYFQITHRYLTA